MYRVTLNGPDKELRMINWVFVNGSMALTAYFGWTLGEGVFVLAVVLAALFGAVSRAAPLLIQYASEYAATHKRQAASLCFAFGCVFFFADVLTNYGAASAIREGNIVRTTNTNNVAADARNEVKRLETRIAEIRAATEWKTDYLSPKAYDAEIFQLKQRTERGKNIYQRSKACTDTTITSSQKVCEAIGTAEANRESAINRLKLKDEVVQLERELKEAKLIAKETPTQASAALFQIKNLAGLLTLSISPSDFAKTWTNSGIMAVAAIIVSLGSVLTAMILGLRIGQRRMEGYDDTPIAQNPHIPDYRDYSERHEPKPDPVDYRSWDDTTRNTPGNSYTIIQNGKKTSVTGDWDAFDQKIAEALRFCEARGTA